MGLKRRFFCVEKPCRRRSGCIIMCRSACDIDSRESVWKEREGGGEREGREREFVQLKHSMHEFLLRKYRATNTNPKLHLQQTRQNARANCLSWNCHDAWQSCWRVKALSYSPSTVYFSRGTLLRGKVSSAHLLLWGQVLGAMCALKSWMYSLDIITASQLCFSDELMAWYCYPKQESRPLDVVCPSVTECRSGADDQVEHS